MKKLLQAVLFLHFTLLAAQASAATVSAQFTQQFGVIFTINKERQEKVTSCNLVHTDDNKKTVPWARSQASELSTPEIPLKSPHWSAFEEAAVGLLNDTTALKCAVGNTGTEDSPQTIQLTSVSATSKMASPFLAFGPDYVWTPLSSKIYGRKLQSALGSMDGCKIKNENSANCSMVRGIDGSITFDIDNRPRSGTIVATFKRVIPRFRRNFKTFNTEIEIPIVTCDTYALQALLPGAKRQRIAVSDRRRCLGDLFLRSGARRMKVHLSKKGQDDELGAMLHKPKTGNGYYLTFSDVRPDLAHGRGQWLLKLRSGLAGTIQMVVAKPLAVNDRLGVHYTDPALESAQSGHSDAGVAVSIPASLKTQCTSSGTDGCGVYNIATVNVPGHLPTTGAGYNLTWRSMPQDTSKVTFDADESMVWTVLEPSWKDQVVLHGCRQGPATGECALDNIQSIRFSALGARGDALKVTLRLYQVRTGTVEVAGRDEQYLFYRRALDLPVTLAKSARLESIPLPIADAATIRCADGPFEGAGEGVDIATNGSRRAIDEGDLTGGGCWAVIDLCAPSFARLRDKKLLPLYGRQALRMTVSRQGLKDETEVVPISINQNLAQCKDATAADKLKNGDMVRATLPAPSGSGGKGAFEVTLDIPRKQAEGVVYRAGTTSTLADGSTLIDSRLRFVATLHPRGTFGFTRVPIRMFATIPVELTGLRFPAAPRDLRSSTAPVVVQVNRPRIGVMVGAEPWNYDTSSHLWPVHLRLLTGLHLFELGDQPTVHASYVAGAAVTLPIIDRPTELESQLDSSVALGFFYEADLRNPATHHFTTTLGFNFLSLMSGK